MKKDKLHIVSMFHLNANIAGKDMFLVPMYLGRHLGASVELVYPKAEFNKEFAGEYRGVKLTPIKSKSKYYSTFWSEKEMGWWLIKNARRIDVLFLFWLNPRNALFARIYKFLNPKGVCYIKGDINRAEPSASKIKQKIWNYLYRSVDVFSVETETIYQQIRQGMMGDRLAQSVVLMSNGFDIETFEQLNIERRSYAQKENVMLTVGRIGSEQKNNEMMLAAVDGLDLKDWKLLLVGPVEDRFRATYDDFITRNPDKRDQVILTGSINDRKELWQTYNMSKVFLLTSPVECMAQVYSEALAFGNYIITTAVQGSIEITDNERLGCIVGLTDTYALRQAIAQIITGEKDISGIASEAIKLSEEKYNWRCLTRGVAQRIREVYDAKHN